MTTSEFSPESVKGREKRGCSGGIWKFWKGNTIKLQSNGKEVEVRGAPKKLRKLERRQRTKSCPSLSTLKGDQLLEGRGEPVTNVNVPSGGRSIESQPESEIDTPHTT
jgi:hypothetical protein